MTRGGSADDDDELSLPEKPGVPGILMSIGWSVAGSLVAARSKLSGESVERPAGGVGAGGDGLSSGFFRSSTGPS